MCTNEELAERIGKVETSQEKLEATQQDILHLINWFNGAWPAMMKGLWLNIGLWVSANKVKAFSLFCGTSVAIFPVLVSLGAFYTQFVVATLDFIQTFKT